MQPDPSAYAASAKVADLYQRLGNIGGLPSREFIAAADALYDLSCAVEGKPAKRRSDPDANARFVLGNIAANGRAFVALLAAVDIALYIGSHDVTFAQWALIAVAGLGAAIVSDRGEIGVWRWFTSLSATSLPAAALFGSFWASF